MTKKQYLICRLIVSFLTAMFVAISMVKNNYIVPLLVIVAGMSLLYSCRKKVQDVLADERDYQVAGKSARYVLYFYSFIGAITSMILFVVAKDNTVLMLLANFLAYSICLLMIVNSMIFKWLNSRK